MRDRFTRGLVAGIVAGIVPFFINWGAFTLNLNTLRWSEFIGMLILGDLPATTGEMLFTIAAQFILLGILGVIFAYLLPLLSVENYQLKGSLYGLAIWFLAFIIVHLFKIGGIFEIPLKTAATNAVAGLFWGLALSIILGWFEHRVEA